MRNGQRHPNQKSTWDMFRGARRKADDPKKEQVASVESDLKALEAVQQSRPTVPPHRRGK